MSRPVPVPSTVKRPALPWALCGALLAFGPAAGAQSAADGHALHAQSCVQCHGTEVYTRTDRKVTSYEGLGRQVQRCETALGLRWFDEDIVAVSAYLNRDFYRLMPPEPAK